MKRVTRWAMRLYPPAWRTRYGREFEALVEDVGPGGRDLWDVVAGGIKMQIMAWTWRRTAAFALAGAAVAGVIAARTPDVYISTAVVRIEPRGSNPPRWLSLGEQDVLSRTSLAEIIRRPGLDLYKDERAEQPLEDIIQAMRDRYIRIVPLQAVRRDDAAAAFEVSFQYRDREKAQAVTKELTERLIEKTKGGRMEVIEPASLPQRPSFLNRLTLVGAGLAVGLGIGLVFLGAKRWPLLTCAALLFIAFFPHQSGEGQTSTERSQFEVASIRYNRSGDVNMGMAAQPGGRFIARNVPVKVLIGAAYDVKDFQIISGSFSWINTERYDITAKAPDGTPNGFDSLKPMLRSLLADRFKLTVHTDTRESPVFDLVATKGGLKPAPPKDASCAPPDPNNPQPRERRPFCDNVRLSTSLVEAYGIVMPRLAAALSEVFGRPVIDRTGFTGIFDAHLEFTPDETVGDTIVGGRGGESLSATDLQKPSIFTALQDQLGVRVNASKGPLDVILVDRVERPSEN